MVATVYGHGAEIVVVCSSYRTGWCTVENMCKTKSASSIEMW